MKLSVIIPIYNAEKYLEQCVKSVLNQTKRDIEVILVDDGSTDRSGDICDQFAQKDNRIVVIHQNNEGIIQARRTGVNCTNSNYLTFVDADDFVDKKSFSMADPFMDEGTEMICFGWYSYDGEADEEAACYIQEGLYDRPRIRQDIYPYMMWDDHLSDGRLNPSVWNKIIKTTHMKKIYHLLWRENFDYGEDRAAIYPLVGMVDNLRIVNRAYYHHRKKKNWEIAGYIKTDSFFDKMYAYYCFCRKNLPRDTDLEMQLELSMMQMISFRRKKYNTAVNNGLIYVFPFDRIKKGENVVLYGAGVVGREYKKQLDAIPYCILTGWVDKNADKYPNNIMPVEYILKTSFDKIVIAIKSLETRKRVSISLKKMGIDGRKIIT